MNVQFSRLLIALSLAYVCCVHAVESGSARLSRAIPAADPVKWEKDIAAFEAEDRTNPPPANATLFVGSSSIRYWTNLAQCFPDWTLIRRGFGGAHLSDLNYYFDRLATKYRPARIIVYAGENDLNAGRSPDDVYNEFLAFARKVRTKLPNAELYYLSMKPSPSRWFLSPQINEGNARIRRYARTHPHVTFIDVGTPLLNANGQPNPRLFANDNLHINLDGYALWTQEIRRAVKK